MEDHEINREEKGLSNKAGGAISAKGDRIFSLGRGYGSGTDEVSQNGITNMIEPRMVDCASSALVRKKGVIMVGSNSSSVVGDGGEGGGVRQNTKYLNIDLLTLTSVRDLSRSS